MKPSPLQLEWLTYPAISFRTLESYEGKMFAAIPAEIDAKIDYKSIGAHVAYLELKNRAGISAPYDFSIVVVAQFKFDLELVKQTYKSASLLSLPEVIAANVSRILYASAREMLALITSRAPHQTAVLESVLLEPRDVAIRSDVSPAEIYRQFFGANDTELEEISKVVSGVKDDPRPKRKSQAKKS